MSETTSDIQNKKDRFFEFLRKLEETTIGRSALINSLLSLLDSLTRNREGMAFLYSQIDEIIGAGIFKGTSWEFEGKLEPKLVRGTLCAGFPSNIYEIISELRLLRMTETGDEKEREIASAFLEEAIISSFDLAFQDSTESSRQEITKSEKRRISILFRFIMDKISVVNLQHKLAEEMLDVAAQRPILTHRLTELIHLAKTNFIEEVEGPENSVLTMFINALFGPTERVRLLGEQGGYYNWLLNADKSALEEEALQCGKSMDKTGLVSVYHLLLIKRILSHFPELVPIALNLTTRGKAEFEDHQKLVTKIIEAYIKTENAQSLFGLAGVLNRNLFSRKAIRNAFIRFFRTEMDKDIVQRLASGDEQKAKARLICGVIGVLGQPLGLGQGNNPTCQSARGISMWSNHSPAKLLDMIYTVAAYNQLTFRYEGQMVKSSGLHMHTSFDFYLDPVSMILVPHLDHVYKKMMELAQMKYPHKDPHTSVNPAFYGHWIQTGFVSAYSHVMHAINQFSRFVRVFYVSFHPEYNGNHYLVYPVPLGIYITNAHADLLGFHAISLLRVRKDKAGEWRAYFYNPNNEGRQNWGQGIKPTVRGNGELPGESSLPFHHLLARVYAFHFNSINIKERLQVVPVDKIDTVTKLAKESWGRNYTWH